MSLNCYWADESKVGGCYACDDRVARVLVIRSNTIETRFCAKHLKEIAGHLK